MLLIKYYPINLVLGVLLLIMFSPESPTLTDFLWSAPLLWKAAYIMCAVFFELVKKSKILGGYKYG